LGDNTRIKPLPHYLPTRDNVAGIAFQNAGKLGGFVQAVRRA